MQKTLSIVDLKSIRHNAEQIIRQIRGKKLFAVVKANAYGHGAVQVAHYLQNTVFGFCVALVDEGVELRVSGITAPILVLTPPMDSVDVEKMKYYSLTPSVNSVATAKMIGDLPCHIQINTGMNRYGCNLNELCDVLTILKSDQIVGVYSHLYQAESALEREKQLFIFDEAERLVKAKSPKAIAHLSASGGTLVGEKFIKDCVRCGILLYGYAPVGFETHPNFQGYRRALTVFARRVQTESVVGDGAGYGLNTSGLKTLATYRLGYADGFFRTTKLGENNLCMDAFVGKDMGELVPVLTDAESYAKLSGTIPYEVLCLATKRSEIIYER